jgi:hypothetical protein
VYARTVKALQCPLTDDELKIVMRGARQCDRMIIESARSANPKKSRPSGFMRSQLCREPLGL